MSTSETPDTSGENGEKRRGGRNGTAHHEDPAGANGEGYVSEEAEESQSETDPGRGRRGRRVVPTLDFDFNGQTIRAAVDDGKEWFLARSVCQLLDLGNTAQVLSRLDDDLKGIINVDTPGGVQAVSVINESGLYKLTQTSRKPEAKAFSNWVNGEVLPSIRKTGRYESKYTRADNEERASNKDTIQVTLPRIGRFIVTALPGKVPTVQETELIAALDDITLTDHQILCHTSRLIAGWWRKMKQLQGIGLDTTDGLAREKLEQAIVEADRLAEHFLWCLSRRDK